jgi:hypothetical protein
MVAADKRCARDLGQHGLSLIVILHECSRTADRLRACRSITYPLALCVERGGHALSAPRQ